MPGRRCSSSTSRTSGSGSKLELHAWRQHAADVLRHLLVGLPVRIVDGGDDQILKHLDVVFRHHFRIDLERLNLLGPVDDDGDHAAAGVALDLELGHLLLQALLHLLRLLHHLLNVHGYISSTSRISAGNISSIVWTPASASACSRSAVFLSGTVSAGAAAAGADASPGICA